MSQKASRYDKEHIEQEAIISKASGVLTNALGRYILDRCRDIAYKYFDTNNPEVRQVLIDEAVMRICERFLYYYEEDKSAANLVIAMAKTTMINKVKSFAWSDIYGQKTKIRMHVFQDGEWVYKFVQSEKDDNLSKEL